MLSVARYPHDIFLDCFPNEWALYKGNRDKVRYNVTEKLLQALETNLLIVPCLNYPPSQESIHYRKKMNDMDNHDTLLKNSVQSCNLSNNCVFLALSSKGE